MGLFSKRSADPDEMERLTADVASLTARLQASETSKTELDTTVRDLVTRLNTPISAPPEAPPVAAAPTIDQAEIDKLNAKMQRIGDRIDAIDQRISSISTELANQITELGGDIDALGGNEPATDEVVDELRDAQTRLAAEQARYQIAFRQDLADVADRLRRP